jgi:hypothetical protein
METRYDIDSWAGRTVAGRRIFNAGFRMLGHELADWQLVKAVPMEASRRDGEFVYIWQRFNGHGRELLRVHTAELPDWRRAQERLREELQMGMRPDIPQGTGQQASIGDVVFVARDPESEVPAAISSTRGNVFSSVRSVGDHIVDVSAVAEWLDRVIGQPPSRSDLHQFPVEARSIEATAGSAGEKRVVIDSIAQVSGFDWLKVLASAGELRREGDSLIYLADAPGPIRLETFVRHSYGDFGQRPDRRPDPRGRPA